MAFQGHADFMMLTGGEPGSPFLGLSHIQSTKFHEMDTWWLTCSRFIKLLLGVKFCSHVVNFIVHFLTLTDLQVPLYVQST